nr:kinesin-related protein 11 [Quercus suber]
MMALSATTTMTSTIPRRPSGVSPLAPPTGPLPALPVVKTRPGSKPLPDAPESSPLETPTTTTNGTPTSGLKPPGRAVTPSALPTLATPKSRSTPAIPTLNTTVTAASRAASPTPSLAAAPSSGIPTPGRTVRKTSSIGAFPVPPKINTRVSSLPPSPLSTATAAADANGGQDPTKSRRDPSKHRSADTGSKRSKTRSSGYGARSRASGVGLGGTPSLLNGTGDNFISSADGVRGSDSLLSLPSPPQSRTSSANGSYIADSSALEDGEESVPERGRPKSTDTVTEGRRGSDAKDNKGNVLVSVRVRPDAGGDGHLPDDGEWMVDGRRSLISYKGREGGDYRYDNVFSPHDNNARVYDNAAKRLVRRVMEGYHGTVFAYGMTGTGKTFSMQGTTASPGVIPLAITDIFSYIRENPNREFLLRVSYLEIYNEKIYDLLSQSTPGQPQQEEIKLREDSKRGVYATPLKEEIVQSPNQLLRVIARGDLARRTGSTQFNARSSRSHAVVQIVVESRVRTPSHGAYFEKETRRNDRVLPGGVLVSTLSLIDLAGSEKAAENKERRTEGAHINKSLLTLGTVIGRLAGDDEKDKDGTTKSAGDKEKGLKHLPYRDSKLTRLLQPALSGNSLVSILCTIQLSSAGTSAVLASSHTGETLNTLKFASRAKNNIVSHAKRNESNAHGGDAGSRALLDRYRMEIQDLRQQLEQQGKAKEEVEKLDEMEQDRKIEEELERQEATRHEEQMLEMQLARTALKERISHLNRLILSSKSLGVNSGRFSSSSVPLHRMSVYSNNEFGRPVSVKSRESVSSNLRRDSSATLEVPSPDEPNDPQALSGGSVISGVMPAAQPSRIVEDEVVGEEDVPGGYDDDPDAHASLAQQNNMLQADLADKNRYIATLEKRLLQARRTSHSRVSKGFSRSSMQGEDGAMENVLREKDREIDELRAKLDDQMRMVTALRSAARKRDMLDNRNSNVSVDTNRPESTNGVTGSLPMRVSSLASTQSGRLRGISGHRSNPSTASRASSGMVVNTSKLPLSPMAILSPSISEHSGDGETNLVSKTTRRKSVDEMTMLLDQMIQEKIESGQVAHGERGSLRVKRDTVMSPPDVEYTTALSPTHSGMNGSGGYMHTLTTQFEEHLEGVEQS